MDETLSSANLATALKNCSVCLEEFVDPRVLPCLHTFCLRCLMECGDKKMPGEKMKCLKCPNEFFIPNDGLNGIPRNDFINKLKDVCDDRNVKPPPLCNPCLDEDPDKSVVAVKNCKQCNQNMCNECLKAHNKMKITKDHETTDITTAIENLSSENKHSERNDSSDHQRDPTTGEDSISSKDSDQCESNNASGLASQSDTTAQHLPNGDRASTDQGRNQENSNRDRSYPSDGKNKTKDTWKLLRMDDFYRGKLTWTHVVTITKESADQTDGLSVLRKLLMFDYNAPIITPPSDDQTTDGATGTNCQQYSTRLSQKFKRTSNPSTHPMDVMNVIYNCCDKILLQKLFGKMFMCRMAIPLAIPDKRNNTSTFSLWSLRSIVPEWKSEDGKLNHLSLVEAKHPMISFVRIGKLRRSKSQLLNALLSPLNHNTFFHRDCRNGMANRSDSNGTIECSFFLPSQNKEAKLREMFSLFNLRGEATEFHRETQLIFQISSLCILMISTSSLRNKEYTKLISEYKSAKCPIVLSFVCDSLEEADSCYEDIEECERFFENIKVKILNGIIDWKEQCVLNAEDWKQDMQSVICQFLSTCVPQTSLTDCKNVVKECGFQTDEDEAYFEETRQTAESLLNSICQIDFKKRKIELLPLQGNLWKKCTELQKKFHREKKLDSIESFIEENNKEQKNVRLEQIGLYQNSSFNFVKALLNSLKSSNMEYLVIWIRLILDEWSRQTLPDLYNKYHESWTRSRRNADSKGEGPDLHKMEQELSDASFGLEHILREFGQIYEAFNLSSSEKISQRIRNVIDRLPSIVAQLLVTGIPFELMDGDVAFVPITWVTAVFAEVQKIIGNKTLFVISVVGIQSSGKSTLLNTMFGLQFAVGAGRCTRGVYCQLIPVDKEKTQLKYDYILVVDTEGLRAPELQKANLIRDNELATFVIGLGDLTIVNIKGETVAEIQDILQIVIHAMLRIKLVNKNINLKPSCFFVHQNVSAISAKEKMKFGQEQFYSYLDKMTEHAANQEKIPNYKHFNEVIQFDEQTHIMYLPDLWQGEQPMATVNGAYREKVEELKSLIIDDMKQHSTVSTVGKISRKMDDLWGAILCENFVFSFKNSEEVTTFSNLEAFMSKINWDFRNESLKLRNRAVTEICSCEKNEISSLQQFHMSEISKALSGKMEVLQKELETYFKENDNKEILEQWRFRSLKHLPNLYQDQLERISADLDVYARRRSMQLDNEQTAKTYDTNVFELAEQTANDLKRSQTTLTEADLERHFEKAWNGWISKLSKGTIDSNSEALVLLDIAKELNHHFHVQNGLLCKILMENPLENLQGRTFRCMMPIQPEDLHYTNDSSGKEQNIGAKVKNWFMQPFSKDITNKCLDSAKEECANVFKKVNRYIQDLSGSDYHPNQAGKVIEIMNEFFRTIESKKETNKFTFQLEFSIKFTIYVCKCAASEFIQMRNSFQKATDPMASILKNKAVLSKLFKNTYFSIANEQKAADVFLCMLAKWLKEAITQDLGRLIAHAVKTSDASFQTKQTFINKVLTDLCEKDEFKEYLKYLTPGETYLRSKITKYRKMIMETKNKKGETKFQSIVRGEIERYVSQVTSILTEMDNATYKNHREFLGVLLSKLRVILTCSSNDARTILDLQGVNNFRNFTKYLRKCCTSLKTELVESTWEYSTTNKLMRGTDPDELLADEVLGCSARCPLCRAPCCRTEKDHWDVGGSDVDGSEADTHRALQHYPIGVRGARDKHTKKLSIYNCQSAVDSDMQYTFQCSTDPDLFKPFKDYKKYHPDWTIAPDRSIKTSLYWKWFMARFNKDLADHHGCQLADIPDSWNEITTEQAIESLQT